MNTGYDSYRPLLVIAENIALYGLLTLLVVSPSLIAFGAFGMALAAPTLFAVRKSD